MSRGVRRLTLHNSSIEKVKTIQRIYQAGCICLICLISTAANAQLCSKWTEAVRIGQLQVQLNEASGVAASRRFPGRLYHINDSGDAGNIYLTGMDGRDTRTVRIAGFDPEDTEGMSLGPCPGNLRASCLYVGDIGDNDRNRKSIEIVVLDEAKNFG